jgi:hypothetical protein
MSYASFLEYIDSKYATEAADAGKTPYEYTNTTVYEYKKIITTTDVYTRTETTKEVSITQDAYNTLVESTNTYDIPGGTNCIVSIKKGITTLFNYEDELNESRRQIRLLNSNYAGDIEQQLKLLMKVA